MRTFLRKLRREFMFALRISPRIYFAPLVGAYRGIRAEYADIESQRKKVRDHSQKLAS